MEVDAAADRVEADHVGAELGERHPAQRRGDERRSLDDAHPVEDIHVGSLRESTDLVPSSDLPTLTANTSATRHVGMGGFR